MDDVRSQLACHSEPSEESLFGLADRLTPEEKFSPALRMTCVEGFGIHLCRQV